MSIPSAEGGLRFRALGPPDLRGPAGTDPAAVLARPKLLALVTFLASAPGGFQRRDTIVGLLWAELDQERARGALRQSLYYLRQFLGDGVVVTRGDDDVGLASDRFQSDLAAFGVALRVGDRAAALEVYRGPLLEGLFLSDAPEFERWLDARREELRRQAQTAALALAERAAAEEGSGGSAVRWAQRAVDLDPLDEGVVRVAIDLCDRMGDRAGAVRLYDAFARRLAEDLDVRPSPETQALIAAVRSRSRPAGDRNASSAPPPSATAASSPPRAGTDDRPVPPPSRAAFTRTEVRIGIAVGTIVVVGLVLLQAFHGGRATTPVVDARRVLVAGFENQTGDSTLDPLGRMAADWITQGLDVLAVVDVVPSAWGLPPRADYGSDSGPTSQGLEAARSAGAGMFVAGRYYRNGDSIDFQTQIVDTRTGRLLRAVPPATGSVTSPGALVDTLRGLVVSAVAAVFDTIARPTAGRRPPSYGAYQAFVAGHRAYQRMPMSMREALTFFEHAVRLDSAFLEPRFYMVWAHMNLGEWDAALAQARFLEDRRPRLSPTQNRVVDWQLGLLHGDHMAVLEAARAVGDSADIGVEAMRVNRLREAIRSLSSVRNLHARYYRWLNLVSVYHMLGDHEQELREAQRARRQYPAGLAMLEAEVAARAALGQLDEVQRLLEESMLHPPEDGRLPIAAAFTAAAELRAHGHRTAALAAADRALAWYEALPPQRAAQPRMRFDRGVAFYIRERWEEARAIFEALLVEEPDQIDLRGFLGTLAARRGDTATAQQVSDALTGTSQLGNLGRDLYWQACIAAQLREPTQAMTLLQEAFARGQSFSIRLHRDMDLEPLWGSEAFRRFLASRD